MPSSVNARNFASLLNFSLKSTDSGCFDALSRFVQDADKVSGNKNFKFASNVELANFRGLSQQLQFLLDFSKIENKRISRGEKEAALTVAAVVKKHLPSLTKLYYSTPSGDFFKPQKKAAAKPFLTMIERGDQKSVFGKKPELLTEDSLAPKPFVTNLQRGEDPFYKSVLRKKPELLTEDSLAPKPFVTNLQRGEDPFYKSVLRKKPELLTEDSLAPKPFIKDSQKRKVLQSKRFFVETEESTQNSLRLDIASETETDSSPSVGSPSSNDSEWSL